MAKALGTNLPAKLVRGQRRFERWRRTHRPHSRLPESLWSLAVQLAREYGIAKVARLLRVDYYGLKKRSELVGANEALKPLATPSFVELLPGGSPVRFECTLECEDGQGGRIRLHFTGQEFPNLSDLADLSRRLWKGDE